MISLPDLDGRAAWSVCILDADDGTPLAQFRPDQQSETASIGKIFLLLEVARRLADGTFSEDQRISIPDEHRVEDSGLLYRMRDQRLTIPDAALLVGAVSDNLATNALIHLCGLDAVRGVASELGYSRTSLLDYIRNERTPDFPWTPSYGTSAELADLMRRLGAGEIFSSPAVCARVLSWLAADTDTSMAADSFLLDPLAHVDAEYQGMVLRHKTGSVSFARADVGLLSGPAARVAYAVVANWKTSPVDLRAPVIDGMRVIGEQIRAHVTARQRDDGTS